MADLQQFRKILSSLSVVRSITGLEYKIRRVTFDKIYFSRETKQKEEIIWINELYELYIQGASINTSIAKKYITGRVQSPSVAILNHIRENTILLASKPALKEPIPFEQIVSQVKTNVRKPIDDKDESRFFFAFSQLAGDKIKSKSIDSPFQDKIVLLDKDFRHYQFEQEINDCYNEILRELQSDFHFGSGSLISYIDGVLETSSGHFRIVEFDEEQHFTPARLVTIKHLKQFLNYPYLSIYESICQNETYYRNEVCQKNRIKKNRNLILDYNQFIAQLADENTSGYIEAKNGFNYIGGRIAQRAYYDTLRDTAHLSPLNENLQPPLRFAKKTFEAIAKKQFKMILNEELKDILSLQLKDLYNVAFD